MENRIYVGDNLDILKSNEIKTFAGKINFIYIDPPYNTANKALSYNDTNNDWFIDISKRLEACYELLSDKGCIFISIDDNELSSLLHLGYKIFNKQNYVGLFITKQAQRSNAKHIYTSILFVSPKTKENCQSSISIDLKTPQNQSKYKQ